MNISCILGCCYIHRKLFLGQLFALCLCCDFIDNRDYQGVYILAVICRNFQVLSVVFLVCL
jgi:hypothetical protein